jgi:hypothetical protein
VVSTKYVAALLLLLLPPTSRRACAWMSCPEPPVAVRRGDLSPPRTQQLVRMYAFDDLDPPKYRCSMLPTSDLNVDDMSRCLLS